LPSLGIREIVMKLTITGYSTAMFATWFFIDELGLLFDAGDGLSAGLLQKSRKVKHVFISHADRDHLAGLLQFNQLNAREDFPVIYYPADSGSFPALAEFMQRFDTQAKGTVWKPIKPGDCIEIKKGVFVEAIRNGHVSAPEGIAKSLSFRVFENKSKLKAEFLHLPGKEIAQLRKEHGPEYTSETERRPIIDYSGDTPVEDLQRWQNSNILIHEATFLGKEMEQGLVKKRNQHSTLEQVIEMVSGIKVQQLVLSHFSSRYAHEEIDAQIEKLCHKYALNIPVYRVLPGTIARNILSEPLLLNS